MKKCLRQASQTRGVAITIAAAQRSLDPNEIVEAWTLRAGGKCRDVTEHAAPLVRWRAAIEVEFCRRLRKSSTVHKALRVLAAGHRPRLRCHQFVAALLWLFKESLAKAPAQFQKQLSGKLRGRRFRARNTARRLPAPPPGMVVVWPVLTRRTASAHRPSLHDMRELRAIRVFQIIVRCGLLRRLPGPRAWGIVVDLVGEFSGHVERVETAARMVSRCRGKRPWRRLRWDVWRALCSINNTRVLFFDGRYSAARAAQAVAALEALQNLWSNVRPLRDRAVITVELQPPRIIAVPAPPADMRLNDGTPRAEWLYRCYEQGLVQHRESGRWRQPTQT